MAFTIPTYFTAVDKFSSPVTKMAATMENFSAKAETSISRAERGFRRLTPAIGEASKQMLSMLGTGALVAASFAGGIFSIKSIMDYETEIANLSAITGTSGKQLEFFKNKIADVAKETRSSSIEVAKAFTLIGNNSPLLLKDAEGLAEVAKQSIVLSRAAKMELGPSAETLTTIMNQFNIPAKEAKGVIDLLAGGMVVGSTNIDAVADAMTRFGGVASQVAGVSMAESVTAIEAISDKMKDAEKVGTQFRNIFLIMSNIKGQDPKALKDLKAVGVNMDIVASKTEPLINKLNELKKLSGRAGALEHVFSKENIQSLVPLLSSTEKYSEMLKTLTTSEDAKNAAQKMADKNSSTLTSSVKRLTDRWVTFITTSDNASTGLKMATRATEFLNRNLETIVTIGVSVLSFFAAWWAIMKLARIGLILYNVAFGVYNALTKGSIFLTEGNIAAKYADLIVTNLMTAAQWALNVAMEANPIGIVIIAVGALAAGIYYLIEAQEILEGIFQSGIEKSKAEQINKQRKEVDALTASYEKQGLTHNVALEKAISREKFINEERNSKLNQNAINAQKKVDSINPVWDFLNGSNESKKAKQEAIEARGALEIGLATKNDLVNPKEVQAQYLSTINNNSKKEVTVDFKNVPKGVDITGDGANNVTPSLSSTMNIK